MKVIHRVIKGVSGEIEIVVIGDTHIGSPNCNESLLKKTIDYVLNKNNCYAILNGDIVDNCLISSVGNIYESQMTPSEAVSYAVMYLKPLADKGKILCTLGGNHDHDRSKKIADISPAEQLASMLGLVELFSADSVILDLNVTDGVKGKSNKNANYVLFISHGRNGGVSTGSKANACEKMSLIFPNADIYIHSHTHSPLSFKDEYVYYDNHKKVPIWKERLYVNTNAFLNYFNSYGEAKMYRPQSQSVPKIRLKSIRMCQNKGLDRVIKSMSCEI